MTSSSFQRGRRVAVLVDCDNVSPDILDFALSKAEELGRLVIRRGYGNRETLAQKWQETLTQLAFTPHLQFQYAPGKNTADIALAIDTLETHVDGRADTFVLVTSDSDFAYLCRKLRERGATVCIVGEAKTPNALRKACDSFFEWTGTAAAPMPKNQPGMLVDAISTLARSTPDGKVGLPALGNYLRQAHPGFSSKTYGHANLSKMLQTYQNLELRKEQNGHSTVVVKRRSAKPAA